MNFNFQNLTEVTRIIYVLFHIMSRFPAKLYLGISKPYKCLQRIPKLLKHAQEMFQMSILLVLSRKPIDLKERERTNQVYYFVSPLNSHCHNLV